MLMIKHTIAPNSASIVDMRLGGERACPGDVAVTCLVESVATFAEDPACAVVTLAEREVIGRGGAPGS